MCLQVHSSSQILNLLDIAQNLSLWSRFLSDPLLIRISFFAVVQLE